MNEHVSVTTDSSGSVRIEIRGKTIEFNSKDEFFLFAKGVEEILDMLIPQDDHQR